PGLSRRKPMARHRTHSIEFKRQVVQEFLAGESPHALAKRHSISRNLIKIWVAKYEAGGLDSDTAAADVLAPGRSRKSRRHGSRYRHYPPCSSIAPVPANPNHTGRAAAVTVLRKFISLVPRLSKLMAAVGLHRPITSVANFSNAPRASNMIMRNTTTTRLELYNIANNQMTGATFWGRSGWIGSSHASPP